jgi:hypothetical protein
MQALAAAEPRIRVLDNPTNLGFGGSYKRGASVATATYVAMLPCDNGFPGQSIAEILGHAGEADIIIPIVTNRGTRHWFRAFASKGFTTLLNWAFWLNVGYYNGACSNVMSCCAPSKSRRTASPTKRRRRSSS